MVRVLIVGLSSDSEPGLSFSSIQRGSALLFDVRDGSQAQHAVSFLLSQHPKLSGPLPRAFHNGVDFGRRHNKVFHTVSVKI